MWSKLLGVVLLLSACEEASDNDPTVPEDASVPESDHDHDHSHEHDTGPDASAGDESDEEHAHPESHAPDDRSDGGQARAVQAASPAKDTATDAMTAASSDDYPWELPKTFPPVPVPADNPMSEAKVELGRHLFYDPRLSDNQTQSCSTCHKQSLAFTDGRQTGLGSTGESHSRSSMALVNVGYAASLTWANPELAVKDNAAQLEKQAEAPLYGTAPIELGMPSKPMLEERLRQVPRYEELFARAFPDEEQPITADNVTRALACFERTLISGNSPFDRFMDGDDSALSADARRGYDLFFGERLECFHCHAGFDFTDHVYYAGQFEVELHYHNTGLYNVDGHGAYPAPNTGVFSFTDEPADMGLFKAPTLRNIAVTAPYMHDGSIATLSEVLDHYAAGGRTIDSGPNQGVGKNSPVKDKLVRGFTLSEQDRHDMIAFLESLTDEAFLTNPAFADPWPQGD